MKKFDQSEHDTRIWYHGTAVSKACLPAPPPFPPPQENTRLTSLADIFPICFFLFPHWGAWSQTKVYVVSLVWISGPHYFQTCAWITILPQLLLSSSHTCNYYCTFKMRPGTKYAWITQNMCNKRSCHHTSKNLPTLLIQLCTASKMRNPFYNQPFNLKVKCCRKNACI